MRYLERAFSLWLMWTLERDEPPKQEAYLGNPDRPADDPFAQASYFFRKAAEKEAQGTPRLIEVNLLRTVWFFFEVEDRGDLLVRKLLKEDDQVRMVKWFWPVFENWELRHEGTDVCWSKVAWENSRGVRTYESPAINRIDKAPSRFAVEWNGRKYVGAAIQDGSLLAVPALGVIAGGNFRCESPESERGAGSCAVDLIVPSKGLDIYDPDRKFKMLEMLD